MPEGSVSDSPESPNRGDARVLIVDDNPANLMALEAVLEPLGVEIRRATSGEEALRQLLQHDFAVVLMDVQMPGLDGFQTTELIRQRDRTRHTPIIFITAIFKDREWAAKGYSLGAYDYLTKPFDEEVLKAKVAALVGAHQQADLIRRQAEALRAKEREADREHAAREAAEAANRAKDEFLAMVSHELRAPLNSILGWSAILEGKNNLGADVQRPVKTIARSARVQSQLIDDLLDVSQIVAGKFRVTPSIADLRQIVETTADAARPSAAAKTIRIEQSIEDADYTLVADDARLAQVVSNLLSNAIKFSNEGGRIEVALSRAGDQFTLAVRDNGVGIAAEFLPHVFERLRQADNSRTRIHGGLGIGLAIAKHIVELHHGAIKAESAGEGQGARFTVQLPVGDVVAARAASRVVASGSVSRACAADSIPRLDGLRVLVVDDDCDAREVFSEFLAGAGASVTIAGSAGEALKLFVPAEFDVVVSDLGMPEEDGLSLIRKIRAIEQQSRRRPVFAIALSGYGSVEDHRQSLEAGFEEHLIKPIEPSELVGAIARRERHDVENS